MKKTLIVAFFLLMGCCAFAQSSNQDFSVNDTLKRSELVKLDLSQQKAIFSTLLPEQCYLLWKTKFADNIHSEKLETGEKAIMHFLYSFLSPSVYDSQEKDAVEQFKKVAETAQNVLELYYDWSPSKIFRYLYTFMTEKEIEAYNASHPGGVL